MNDRGIGNVYEDIADWFDQNRDKRLIEKAYLTSLLEKINPNPTILDLGCGSGEPIARFLIEKGCTVTGVDGSAKMIAMCKERFPQMEWIRSDMRELNLGRKFDAIIAWDSFFHLSVDDQRNMFPVFDSHVAPGGTLLFTSGTENGEVYGQMEGHKVYHASLDSKEYRSLLKQYGFEVLIHAVNDADCGNRNVWLAIRRRPDEQMS
ncbi:MAG: class I SAM-dependent methyltransferase [Cytophagales bacterium]|jgi:cyclopropane fatty-acyl-phospholipid synthase-like methyltransferase|nr:class I SAM-dependent methyltransferase [Cytophagales bacterium]